MSDRQGGVAPLSERVYYFIQKHHLVSPQETLVVGVSGGPDSVCLLHLLREMQPRLDIRLHIAHLNHQWRGAESQADAKYVADLSQWLGVPAAIKTQEIRRTKHHSSREEAARKARYRFFAELAHSLGASKVAVGHNAADQRETILLQLIRGAGALRGMAPLAIWKAPQESFRLEVARPLLEIEREEIEAYCQQYQLSPRRDSSNLSPTFLRNRIRHELLPLLESYNPKVGEALQRLAAIAAEESAFFGLQASLVAREMIEEQEGVLRLKVPEVLSLPLALQRHLLRLALRRLQGDLRDIEWKHIELLRQALSQPPGKKLSLPGGIVFVTEYGTGVLTTDPAKLCPFLPLPGETPLEVPGESILPGWKVRASRKEVESLPETLSPSSASAWAACMDWEKAGQPLLVRTRRPGDRFQPLGMNQPKSLQDFMVDAKIPASWRSCIPLVCSHQRILWVVGWRIAESARVTSATREVLFLEFVPLLPRSASSS